MEIESEVVIGSPRLLDVEISPVLPRRIQTVSALDVVVKVLQGLVNELLNPTRDALLVILVVMLELQALRLELVELHEARESLVEVEDLLARLVWELVASSPNVFRNLAQNHQERLQFSNTPNLLLLVLNRVVQCIFLLVFRLDVHING